MESHWKHGNEIVCSGKSQRIIFERWQDWNSNRIPMSDVGGGVCNGNSEVTECEEKEVS